MYFYKYVIIFLIFLNLTIIGNESKDKPYAGPNNSNKSSQESSMQSIPGASQQYLDVVNSAIDKAPWPDPRTSDFLFSTAPQEMRDFVEIINNIVELYVSGKKNKQILSKAIPKRLLLVGPPGVGKSTLALVIGQKLKRDCYFIRTPMLGTEYQNSETSNLVRFITQVLDENKPCVIILDEINIFAEKKSFQGADLNTASVLWLLLDKCAQNPNILIIGTCNNATELAPQLKDRFEGSIIEIPAINAEQRLGILSHYLSRFNHVCSSKCLNSLVKKMNDFSPRQIEAFVNLAYQQCILRCLGEVIVEADLCKAYARFGASSQILYSRLASIKKWATEHGPIISTVAGSINLVALVGSIVFMACSSVFKTNKNITGSINFNPVNRWLAYDAC